MFMVRLMMTSHVLLIAWVLDIDLAGKSTRIGRRLQFELHSNLENCSAEWKCTVEGDLEMEMEIW